MTLQQFIFSMLLILLAFNLNAQKILQIEKVGSTKLVRFYLGNEITFKLKNQEGWFTRRIEDIDANQNLVLFEEQGFVNIKDISFIRRSEANRRSKDIGNSMYIFGANWGFWSLASTLVGDELTWLAVIVPAVAFVIGIVIKWLGKKKVWKMGQRRRLRVLDLEFFPTGA